MDHDEAGRHWEANAEAWTRLARAGYDVYRDGFNTPAFFEMLPEIKGLAGLDIGCGEGHNTRLLARQGARVTGIDISPTFVRYAEEAEETHPLGIRYEVASALDLPFADAGFDFATAFMSLMDMPETGRVYAREVGDYFRGLDGETEEWIFSATPPEVKEGWEPCRVPRFTRTLSGWLNLLLDGGFVLESFGEPRPSDKAVRDHPRLQSAQVVAFLLHVRARKPP